MVRKVLLSLAVAALAVAGGMRASVKVSAQSAAAPTFNHDVAPILYTKCATCHRSGAGGPMALTSYKDVRPWARDIKTRVQKREMPPWSADPRWGDYRNDISLTAQQINTITAWVDGGMLEGAGPAPVVPQYPDGGWRLVNGRPPDIILEMPTTYELPAEGQVPIFRVWDKNPFKEDVFIEALQIRPTNVAVTHHSALYGRALPANTTLQKQVAWPGGPELSYIPTYADGSIVDVLSGLGGNLSSAIREDGEPGNGSLEQRFKVNPGDKVPVINRTRQATEEDDERLMFYLPGADFQQFAPGSAKRIRASNALMWEVHYSPDGKPEKDTERIGLWLAPKDKVQKQVHILRNGNGQHIIENEEVGSVANLPAIPPNVADWKITAIQPFTQDVTLNTMQPHMHLRGHDMTYVAKYPDGHEEILLSVPKYELQLAEHLHPEAAVQAAGGHRARDGRPLRQLGAEPRESHAEPAGALVGADVGRDVQRVDGNHLRRGNESEPEHGGSANRCSGSVEEQSDHDARGVRGANERSRDVAYDERGEARDAGADTGRRCSGAVGRRSCRARHAQRDEGRKGTGGEARGRHPVVRSDRRGRLRVPGDGGAVPDAQGALSD